MRPRVGCIYVYVGNFWRIIAADHRLGQAVWMLDIVETETPLDAETVLVGRSGAALHGDNLVVVINLVGDLAANATIWADAFDLA